jgi:ketosteroid isomerase-like protein
MSEENVEIVRRVYRAFEARDFDALATLAHNDAEWIPDWRVGKGPLRGLENVVRFFREQDEMVAEFRVEPERFWETGDKVLVFVHATGRGRASDAPFDIRIAAIWTLKDGVVVRGEGFADRDEALEAVGLSE